MKAFLRTFSSTLHHVCGIDCSLVDGAAPGVRRRAPPSASPGLLGRSVARRRGVAVEKFFIVGCPRSGTTMVQQALNRHSQVAIPPETKFFFSFFGHSRARQLRHIDRLNEDLRIRLPRPAARVRSVAEGRAFYE